MRFFFLRKAVFNPKKESDPFILSTFKSPFTAFIRQQEVKEIKPSEAGKKQNN